ncbi:MAG: pyridoxal-phosphate dependent enzyme [Alphaproteobacteria bacterium]|nr:pyridoxal-phosphate dependent enzyme [Alphaproteobacteria bacterium]
MAGDAIGVRRVTGAEVEAAARRLSGHMTATPLIASPALSDLLGADVWLKLESASEIASFKLRGALNALLSVGNAKSAITSSTGNHGQGVTLAARRLGIPAEIFVPDDPNPVKVRMIELLGGRVHVGGIDIDDAKARAYAYQEKHGGSFVDDGENADLIAGAGTVGLEIGRALPNIDRLYVPMGSGSLASGTAVGVKHVQPKVRVTAVQAAGAPAMVESFHAKRAIERPIATRADCLVCRIPAAQALSTLIAAVDDAATVSDQEMLAAVHTYLARAHLLIELGSAAPLVAAWNERAEFKGKRVAIVVSGANAVPEIVAEALKTPPLGGAFA